MKKRITTKGMKFGVHLIRSLTEKEWLRYKVDVIVKDVAIEVKREEEIPMICYWEIMYQYLNPEISLAYPQHVFPKDKVRGRTYYGTKAACQMECNIVNETERTRPVQYKIAGYQL